MLPSSHATALVDVVVNASAASFQTMSTGRIIHCLAACLQTGTTMPLDLVVEATKRGMEIDSLEEIEV